jgi:hypothetical protein
LGRFCLKNTIRRLNILNVSCQHYRKKVVRDEDIAGKVLNEKNGKYEPKSRPA